MSRALIALVVGLIVVVGATARVPNTDAELSAYTFEKYVADFNKPYKAGSAEYARRKQMFTAQLTHIIAHNAQPSVSYRKGINHMTDLSQEEFKAMLGSKATTMGPKVFSDHQRRGIAKLRTSNGKAVLPKSVDWRTNVPNVVSAVKNQGQCGSCWAHGATEQLESYWALATGNLFVLSTQQTTACTANTQQCGGNGGCGGATAELGYEQAMNSSLTEEWQYPYTAYHGTTGVCGIPSGSVKEIQVSSYVKLESNSQEAVMEALATTGPLAVNVWAEPWMSYKSGVFDGCSKSAANGTNVDIDHVVQLVGYGTDESTGKDYFLIRNSWSPAWGESGYIRIARNAVATCNIDHTPRDGTGCAGGPASVKVCGECGVLYDTSYPIVSP